MRTLGTVANTRRVFDPRERLRPQATGRSAAAMDAGGMAYLVPGTSAAGTNTWPGDFRRI
jgi:hypothetical protein